MQTMKKNILAIISILFTVFIPSITKAVEVGGIISSDTIWTLANSPYTATKAIQIAQGVTLSIDPGVVINGANIELWGSLKAIGTKDSKITFNGLSISTGSNAAYMNVDIQHSEINDLNQIIIAHANLTIRDSIIRKSPKSSGQIIIDYPASDSFFERNVFLGCFICYWNPSYREKAFIRNNVWFGKSGGCGTSSSTLLTIYEFNSFLDPHRLPFMTCEYTPIITNNYWGTTETSIIDSLIIDKNDDLNCPNYVNYLPILTSPHLDTPVFIPNYAPTANAGPDQVVFDKVTLDGTGSSDPDGTIISWEWALTHRTNPLFNRAATGPNTVVSNLAPGYYDVILTVTDNLGAAASDSMILAASGKWSISGDNKLGLAEVVYILQILSGSRD